MSLFAEYEPAPVRRPEPIATRVRVARPEDAAAITRLIVAREGRDPDATAAQIQAELRSMTPDGDNVVFVAEADRAVAGFARLRRVELPADAPPNAVPGGWYLLGVIVDPAWRRRGLATALTRTRLDWAARRTDVVRYFVNVANRTSIALHDAFGFREVTRDFHYPNVTFGGGVGVLYELRLPR